MILSYFLTFLLCILFVIYKIIRIILSNIMILVKYIFFFFCFFLNNMDDKLSTSNSLRKSWIEEYSEILVLNFEILSFCKITICIILSYFIIYKIIKIILSNIIIFFFFVSFWISLLFSPILQEKGALNIDHYSDEILILNFEILDFCRRRITAYLHLLYIILSYFVYFS